MTERQGDYCDRETTVTERQGDYCDRETGRLL